jgi:hypothetical protein
MKNLCEPWNVTYLNKKRRPKVMEIIQNNIPLSIMQRWFLTQCHTLFNNTERPNWGLNSLFEEITSPFTAHHTSSIQTSLYIEHYTDKFKNKPCSWPTQFPNHSHCWLLQESSASPMHHQDGMGTHELYLSGLPGFNNA